MEISDWRYLAGGIALYTLVALPVALAFKYTDFGQLFLIWEAAAVILGILIARFYFNEPVTAYKSIALVLALAAAFFAYKK
ncbi:MAG: hypothetical protein HY981_01330 [Candidatus Magasanikbacteria bacterium]|nr:hypothetical protein [Candidatus Magasanikbacteria bacterium]